MSRRGAEDKPAWSAVPIAVRERVAKILGSPVARASRVYGGYAPSATFRLALRNGRRAFLKSTYPLPAGSAVKWTVAAEERVYKELGRQMVRWAPRFYGSFELEGWHVLLLEDLGPSSVPPWTEAKTRLAARDYARFHKSTLGTRLPRWLSRSEHSEFAVFWKGLVDRAEIAKVAALARRRKAEGEEWLDVALPVLLENEYRLARAPRPFALLHVDTRSDNIRLSGERLRIFDWPYAAVGPAEFDVAAFAQAVTMEGGPAPERVVGWYEEVLPLRPRVIDASIAGIAGYFADRAWRPAQPGLPRIRSVQRRQLKASLAWAARRLDLPDPTWLAAVPD